MGLLDRYDYNLLSLLDFSVIVEDDDNPPSGFVSGFGYSSLFIKDVFNSYQKAYTRAISIWNK
tara:strand:+ start:798 stop:986 length:189 start_codon:yes stop_codon:yes gene_type:complete